MKRAVILALACVCVLLLVGIASVLWSMRDLRTHTPALDQTKPRDPDNRIVSQVLSDERPRPEREVVRPTETPVPRAADAQSEAPRPVRAKRPTSTLTGIVVDAVTAAPIAGAAIAIADVSTATSDAEGHFRIENIAAASSMRGIEAHAHGYAPQFAPLMIDGKQPELTLRLELDPALTLRGLVVDETRQPLAGVQVELNQRVAFTAFSSETVRSWVSSAPDGRFEFTEAAPGASYALVLTKTAFATSWANAGPLGASAGPIDLGAFVLERPASISGRVDGLASELSMRVVLRREQTPVIARLVAPRSGGSNSGGPGGAKSTESVASSTDESTLVANRRTRAAGEFEFTDLSSGKYRIEALARADGVRGAETMVLGSATVELAAGERRRDVVVSISRFALRGRVIDDHGEPVKWITVSACRSDNQTATVVSTSTDLDGRFRMPVQDIGPFQLRVGDATMRFAPQTLDQVLASTDELEIRLFAFVSEHAIRGHVFGPDGKPAKEVFVAFTNSVTGERLGRVGIPADATGVFEMRNLEDVAYTLEIVDFQTKYQPVRREGVRPNGDDVEFRLEVRK